MSIEIAMAHVSKSPIQRPFNDPWYAIQLPFNDPSFTFEGSLSFHSTTLRSAMAVIKIIAQKYLLIDSRKVETT
jgi:hypothetical protein